MQDQVVLILGLGSSGLAMARWCARLGAAVRVADTRAQPPKLAALRSELPQVQFVSASLDGALLASTGCSAVYASPGLAPAAFAGLRDAAAAAGIALGGELDLFGAALAALRQSRSYQPRVLAVTGSNGKTTVTALTGQLVQRAGKSVAVAGNIGPTLLDTLAERLDADALPEVWVLELSSFQLAAATGFEPDAATVLNISQDHLDWHGDMPAYVAAKARVFGRHGLMLLNRDDQQVMALLPPPPKGQARRAHLSFGSGLPQRAGDYGMEQVHGMVWLVRCLEAEEGGRKRRSAAPEELHIQRLMPADALRIRGRHNAANALAALALAHAAGCALGAMLYGLREYRGEPHRVEPIGSIGGVEFFDDSKGTNVGATVAALNGLGAERKLVVILGGDGKGQDFAPLAAPVARHVRAALLIGRDGPRIGVALESTGVPLLAAATLPQAVQMALQQARTGDAVLLSPACASFDMFDNYGHRARVFRAAVQALALDAGVMLEGGV